MSARMTPRVWSVGTSVPDHEHTQAAVRAFAKRHFENRLPHSKRLLGAFDSAGIERRRFVRPLEWFSQPRSFAEKNEVYRRSALSLARDAARSAMQGADVRPRDIGAIVFVSSTGISTPSLDSSLTIELDLERTVTRVPLWGLGCAGGAAGLARAADLVRAQGRPVLLVAAEACSTTFVHGDNSKSNFVATVLFGDGAAAAVVGPSRSISSRSSDGPEVVVHRSLLLDDTEDVMGWTLVDEGLEVRFARSIPHLVREVVPSFCKALANKAEISLADVQHHVFHPGGAKVLEAYAAALDLGARALDSSRSVLREHGNMSSPTVLFVLERTLQIARPSDLGLLLALGPGFCAEGVCLRW